MSKTPAELVLERKKREYIPPARPQGPTSDLNLNPLSSRGSLDGLTFTFSLIAIVTSAYLLNYVIRGHLQMARVSLDMSKSIQFYAIWTVTSLLFFTMVSATFIKRWKYLLREDVGGFTRMIFRFMLLSPMFSIWFTLFTFMNGVGALRGVRIVAAIASLIVFHMGVVGWLIYDGQVTAGPGIRVSLANERSPEQSVKELFPANARVRWLPNEQFVIHAYPYINPLGKMALSLYSDFSRVQALFAETSDRTSPLCSQKLGYLGHPVEDCFFFNYRKLAKLHPFTTPVIASYFEDLYRKEAHTPAIGDKSAASNPIAALAPAMLSTNNLVTLMEFGEGTRSRRWLVHPIGLARIYSSPEIVALEIGQDAQRIMLSKRVLPVIRPQLEAIEKNSLMLQSVMTRTQSDDLEIELNDLVARINAIERDPLGLGQSFAEEGGAKNSGAPSKE